jgi:hypothetical protein
MFQNSKSASTALLAWLDGLGGSTKPTYKSEVAGPISIVPSTKKERPSISCYGPSGMSPGFKHFRRAATTIAGIELMHRIRKGQFTLGTLHVKSKSAPEIWNVALAA